MSHWCQRRVWLTCSFFHRALVQPLSSTWPPKCITLFRLVLWKSWGATPGQDSQQFQKVLREARTGGGWGEIKWERKKLKRKTAGRHTKELTAMSRYGAKFQSLLRSRSGQFEAFFNCEPDPCQHLAVWPLAEQATYRNHGLPACTPPAFSRGTSQQMFSNSRPLFSSELMYRCFLPLCARCLILGCGWRHGVLPSAAQPGESHRSQLLTSLEQDRRAAEEDGTTWRKTGLETWSNKQNSNQNL